MSDIYYLFSDLAYALEENGLGFKSITVNVSSKQFSRFLSALGHDRRVLPYGAVVDGDVRIAELRLQTPFGEFIISEVSE